MISCHVEFKFCMCTKIRISVFFVTYLSMAQDFSCQSIFFNKLLLLLLLEKWLQKLNGLCAVARAAPHVAWSLYIICYRQCFDYFSRVNEFEIVRRCFEEVDQKVNNEFLPLLFHCNFKPVQMNLKRRLMSLPIRHGGMSLAAFNIREMSDLLFDSSKEMTVRVVDSLMNSRIYGCVPPEQRTMEYVDAQVTYARMRHDKMLKIYRPIQQDLVDSDSANLKKRMFENADRGTNTWIGNGHWQRGHNLTAAQQTVL